MYAKLIDWLQDDAHAWAVTYGAIGIIVYIAFIAQSIVIPAPEVQPQTYHFLPLSEPDTYYPGRTPERQCQLYAYIRL